MALAAAAFGAGYAATKGLDALGDATGLWHKGTQGKPVKKTGVYMLKKGEHIITPKQSQKAKKNTKALLKKAFKEGEKHGKKHSKTGAVKGTRITKGPHKGEKRYTTKKGGVRRTARKAYK